MAYNGTRPGNDRGFRPSGGKPGGYGGSGGYSGDRRTQTPAPPAKLPDNYLVSGYYTSDNEYDISYVTDKAESIGVALANSVEKTANSKVRAYFDAVEMTHRQLMTNGITAGQARTSLATLKARVSNTEAKGNASKLFKDFITKNVDLVIKSDIKDLAHNLTGFKQHFEAVVCYMH